MPSWLMARLPRRPLTIICWDVDGVAEGVAKDVPRPLPRAVRCCRWLLQISVALLLLGIPLAADFAVRASPNRVAITSQALPAPSLSGSQPAGDQLSRRLARDPHNLRPGHLARLSSWMPAPSLGQVPLITSLGVRLKQILGPQPKATGVAWPLVEIGRAHV